jgi:hypothetical protein
MSHCFCREHQIDYSLQSTCRHLCRAPGSTIVQCCRSIVTIVDCYRSLVACTNVEVDIERSLSVYNRNPQSRQQQVNNHLALVDECCPRPRPSRACFAEKSRRHGVSNSLERGGGFQVAWIGGFPDLLAGSVWLTKRKTGPHEPSRACGMLPRT